MTTIKDDIKTVLCRHPGIRQREIAGYLHVWFCDSDFLSAMHELERNNEIRCESFSDPANMEFYNKWFLVEV